MSLNPGVWLSTDFYKLYLVEELTRRCKKNSRYSLRAFAKSLDLDAGYLSRVFSGQRILSCKKAASLATKLEMSELQKHRFLESVANDRKKHNLKSTSEEILQTEPISLELDVFSTISDIYHYGIMALTLLEGFDATPQTVAHAFGLRLDEAGYAIERLIRLGLLARKEGKLLVTTKAVTTDNKEVTTVAHKEHQRQVLEMALSSLESDPIEVRNMTSMTMAIDKEKIPQAKKMIESFTAELCEFLESNEKNSVYELGISLFPFRKKSDPSIGELKNV